MNIKFKKSDWMLVAACLFTIIVLVIGVFSIDYFLNYRFDGEHVNEDDTSEVIYEDEINILEEDGDFKKYYISVQDTSFSAEIESLTIDVLDDSFSINGIEVVDNAYPTKFISFYGDKAVFPFMYNDSWYGGLIIYDTSNGEYELIDNLADKYIYNAPEKFASSNDGITIETTIVDGNRIFIDDKEYDVCSIKKSKKMKVQENIFIKYDKKKNKLDFKKYNTISSINLESYRFSNDLCQ